MDLERMRRTRPKQRRLRFHLFFCFECHFYIYMSFLQVDLDNTTESVPGFPSNTLYGLRTVYESVHERSRRKVYLVNWWDDTPSF